ncbi:hypothetical protein EVAR_88904_1 [Eumeta japonica]|uniref:Uncharacterized protein n=1 Tax=Eumeta variegata TaxID=151549 RepID=A0A4C1VQA8_EUMVA|nr:hypothetical protein EVAR_88904_1 [Eumeta japonica]
MAVEHQINNILFSADRGQFNWERGYKSDSDSSQASTPASAPNQNVDNFEDSEHSDDFSDLIRFNNLLWRRQKADEVMGFGDDEPADLPKENALRNAKYTEKKKDLGLKPFSHPVLAVEDLKSDPKYSEAIHEISLNKIDTTVSNEDIETTSEAYETLKDAEEEQNEHQDSTASLECECPEVNIGSTISDDSNNNHTANSYTNGSPIIPIDLSLPK